MDPREAYDELIRRVRDEALLASCEALLEWDEETYMPPGGVENRSRQMALLAGLVHDRGADPRLGDLLAAVEASPLVADADSPEAVNVRELRRAYDREVRLPRPLVEETARVTALAQQAWEQARQRSDFALLMPHLTQVFRLAREAAEAVGYTDEPYDALLEDYEPGMTAKRLDALFAALRPRNEALLDDLRGSSSPPAADLSSRTFPVAVQQAFGGEVAAALGFDFQRGRLDTSVHPFSTSIGPGDCRITARFDPRDFTSGLFAVLHEVGHGLYEQGLDPAHHGTPMGEQASLGLDESQSRLWENRVGRSRGFWIHFFPRAKERFARGLAGVDLDAFHPAVRRVEPSLLRATADEVTYDLHILVRFELERAMVRGDLRVVDLPAAWAEAYRTALGVEPRNDAEGCLQDGHWAEGLVGYFPTYTLGNVFAAQLFRAADRDLGGLDAAFARGELRPLLDWMRAHVHRHGSRYAAWDLVERATGKPPDPASLHETLREQYGAPYRL